MNNSKKLWYWNSWQTIYTVIQNVNGQLIVSKMLDHLTHTTPWTSVWIVFDAFDNYLLLVLHYHNLGREGILIFKYLNINLQSAKFVSRNLGITGTLKIVWIISRPSSYLILYALCFFWIYLQDSVWDKTYLLSKSVFLRPNLMNVTSIGCNRESFDTTDCSLLYIWP